MKRKFLATLLVAILLATATSAVYPDPGHPASDIGGGEFYGDNFSFPQQVNVTGDFRVDTQVLYVDTTNDYVGINTTNPNATLTVNGTVQIIGDLFATGSKAGFLADEARNADVQELTPGDLVSISFDDAVEYLPGRSVPIFNVVKAGPQNKLDVVGVVYKKSPYATRQSAGNQIVPGDQMIVATQNAVSFLKVTTQNGPIVPGDYLTPADTPGYAMKADANSVLIVGRALDTLVSGIGQIGAFISIGMKDPYTDVNADRLVEQPVLPTKLANLGIAKPTETSTATNAPADRRIAELERQVAELQTLLSNQNQTNVTESPPVQRTEHGIVIQLS